MLPGVATASPFSSSSFSVSVTLLNNSEVEYWLKASQSSRISRDRAR